jgi:hypothetical protein
MKHQAAVGEDPRASARPDAGMLPPLAFEELEMVPPQTGVFEAALWRLYGGGVAPRSDRGGASVVGPILIGRGSRSECASLGLGPTLSAALDPANRL